MKIERPYPLYPLPADYESLTAEGQRQARIATVSDVSTPWKLVLAWDLFRRVYLGGSKEAVFYKDGFVESPDFHAGMVYALGQYARNAWAAPRGSAKSTVITLEIPLLLSLVIPNIDILLTFATERQKTPRFDVLMTQFRQNELILEDFGDVVPRRGQATWNHELLQLKNGSSIAGQSVMGKKRGGRPRLLGMDDPENDPESKSETSREELLDKFETMLFKQMIPMLKEGSCMFWVGTLIDRKSFLYRAVMGDDPRFDFWNRVVLRAIAYEEHDQTKYHLLWSEMWSKEMLEARREEIGESAFASEYCNEPVSAQERILVIDPHKNEYHVDGTLDTNNPLMHTGLVHWEIREDTPAGRVYKPMSCPFNEMVTPMYRVLLFDYARGLSRYNDYACIDVAGFDHLNTLWLLYSWMGRAKRDTLLRLIFEIGLAWRPRVLGIESVSVQMDFTDALKEFMRSQETQGVLPGTWRPNVFPIVYPKSESKGDRISSLEWRFNSGRIKLPVHLSHIWPYDQLYAQIRDFTSDLALLQHDDAIDTLAMSKYVIKSRGGAYIKELTRPTLLEQIVQNKPLVPGMPLLAGVSSAEITGEIMDALAEVNRRAKINVDNRKLIRPQSRDTRRSRKIVEQMKKDLNKT